MLDVPTSSRRRPPNKQASKKRTWAARKAAKRRQACGVADGAVRDAAPLSVPCSDEAGYSSRAAHSGHADHRGRESSGHSDPSDHSDRADHSAGAGPCGRDDLGRADQPNPFQPDHSDHSDRQSDRHSPDECPGRELDCIASGALAFLCQLGLPTPLDGWRLSLPTQPAGPKAPGCAAKGVIHAGHATDRDGGRCGDGGGDPAHHGSHDDRPGLGHRTAHSPAELGGLGCPWCSAALAGGACLSCGVEWLRLEAEDAYYHHHDAPARTPHGRPRRGVSRELRSLLAAVHGRGVLAGLAPRARPSRCPEGPFFTRLCCSPSASSAHLSGATSTTAFSSLGCPAGRPPSVYHADQSLTTPTTSPTAPDHQSNHRSYHQSGHQSGPQSDHLPGNTAYVTNS